MANSQNDTRSVGVYNPPTIVTAEEFVQNQARINHYRRLLGEYEAQNNEAYRRSVTQELEQRVRDGQHAEQILSQFKAESSANLVVASGPSRNIIPPLPPVSNSSGPTPQCVSQSSDVIIPTTATIVEIPPSSTSPISSSRLSTLSVSAPNATSSVRPPRNMPHPQNAGLPYHGVTHQQQVAQSMYPQQASNTAYQAAQTFRIPDYQHQPPQQTNQPAQPQHVRGPSHQNYAYASWSQPSHPTFSQAYFHQQVPLQASASSSASHQPLRPSSSSTSSLRGALDEGFSNNAQTSHISRPPSANNGRATAPTSVGQARPSGSYAAGTSGVPPQQTPTHTSRSANNNRATATPSVGQAHPSGVHAAGTSGAPSHRSTRQDVLTKTQVLQQLIQIAPLGPEAIRKFMQTHRLSSADARNLLAEAAANITQRRPATPTESSHGFVLGINAETNVSSASGGASTSGSIQPMNIHQHAVTQMKPNQATTQTQAPHPSASTRISPTSSAPINSRSHAPSIIQPTSHPAVFPGGSKHIRPDVPTAFSNDTTPVPATLTLPQTIQIPAVNQNRVLDANPSSLGSTHSVDRPWPPHQQSQSHSMQGPRYFGYPYNSNGQPITFPFTPTSQGQQLQASETRIQLPTTESVKRSTATAVQLSPTAAPDPSSTPGPSTPINTRGPIKPRTPQQADTSRLARDILRSLGRVPNTKHSRVQEKSTDEAIVEHPHQMNNLPVPLPAVERPPSPPSVEKQPQQAPIELATDSEHAIAVDVDREPVVMSPKPPVSDRDSPVSYRELPIIGHEQPVLDGGLPVIGNEQLVLDDEQPVAENEQSVLEHEQPMLDREPSVSDGAQPVLGDETLLLEQQQSMLDPEPPVHELGGLSITEPALKATSEDIEMISPSSPTAREVETPVSPPHIHQSKTSIPNIPISAPPHQEPAAEPSSSKEKLPLFLPSPSPSPTPSERPPKRAIDQEEIIIIDDGPPSSGSPSPQEVIMMDVDESDLPRRMAKKKREQPFYILVPPPPRDWKLGAKRRRTRQKGYSQKVQDLDHEDEVPAYSMAEQIALDESLYRVMERPCRWKNCDAIMNSGGNMLKHLELHATGSGKRASSLCGWKGCQRRFSSPTSRRTHLEGHAYYPIPCRHPGCSETFLQPVELMHHDLRFHSQSQPHNSLIRTTARPFAPTIAQSLGVVPRILPAYRVEPRHIRQIGITLQRHRVIGPQVLQNIFAPVELNLRKQNAPMRSRNSNQMGGTDDRSRSLGARPDEYDFLASLSSASSKLSALDKLDSETVSQMAATGLALFGPEPGSHSEEGVEEDIDMEDIDADLEESVVELEETQEAHGIQPGIPDNIVSVSDTEGPKDSVDAAIVEGSHGGNTVSVEMMA